jgi:hypothetical protein
VGTLEVEVPRARSCGADVLTPGGSAVIFVPENIVSMLAVGGPGEGPDRCLRVGE